MERTSTTLIYESGCSFCLRAVVGIANVEIWLFFAFAFTFIMTMSVAMMMSVSMTVPVPMITTVSVVFWSLRLVLLFFFMLARGQTRLGEIVAPYITSRCFPNVFEVFPKMPSYLLELVRQGLPLADA